MSNNGALNLNANNHKGTHRLIHIIIHSFCEYYRENLVTRGFPLDKLGRISFTLFPFCLLRRPRLQEILHVAGWPVWLLIATSIICVALIIERMLSLRSGHVIPPRLPSHALDLVRQQKDTPEAIIRLAQRAPLGRVLAEVLANRDQPRDYRIAAIEDVGKDVAFSLNRYLPALATIAVIAPLLGLFGTVIGMIDIFGAYTVVGGDPSQLARGISMALYNTAFGIIIAIPALAFHRYFRMRADYYLHRMEREASALDRLLTRQQTFQP